MATDFSVRRSLGFGIGILLVIALSAATASVTNGASLSGTPANQSIRAAPTPSGAHADDDDTICEDGLMLSVWTPQDNLTTGDRFARGMVYFLALLYLFIGVSIVSDRFMAAVEVITSREKEVRVKKQDRKSVV